MLITDSTERGDVTIAGETFGVYRPFGEGYTLTANEAGAMNQLFAENIRNNFAGDVTKAKEALTEGQTLDKDVLQSQLDEYMLEYQFGARSGGGRSGDPLMQEAMSIARDLVRQRIQQVSAQDSTKPKLKDYKAAQISEMAKKVIDSGKYPKIMETAKARVEAQKGLSLDEPLDLAAPTPETVTTPTTAETGEPTGETEGTAPATRSRRGAASE